MQKDITRIDLDYFESLIIPLRKKHQSAENAPDQDIIEYEKYKRKEEDAIYSFDNNCRLLTTNFHEKTPKSTVPISEDFDVLIRGNPSVSMASHSVVAHGARVEKTFFLAL